jgi:Glycosyltransferase family 87
MRRALLAFATALLLWPAAATAGPERISEAVAIRVADRDSKVVEQRRENGTLGSSANLEDGSWEVAYFAGGDQVALVLVDPSSGEVKESWTGYQVAWKMARGYSGAFGHKLNAPYVFLPLCALFLLGLVDWRRLRRVANLDLRGRGPGLRPIWPAAWLIVAALFLMGVRVGLNLADSGAIDVGYASVVGADRIVHGEPIYDNFPDDVSQGDTYGPATYLAYVPADLIWPWSGSWDDLPAAHGGAVLFDFGTFLLLILLARRIRPGPDGQKLAATLAFGWAAYPYTAFALESNSNDALVALLLVATLLALARPLTRGALAALATLAKFAPALLAPMLLTYESRRRSMLVFASGFAAVSALLMLWPAIDPGLHTVYDRTITYQQSRDSPFSVWGQVELEPLRTALLAATAGLSLLLAFRPRRKSPTQVAALAAALLIALQLTMQHWFYLYIVWFFPLLLVALATTRPEPEPSPARTSPPAHAG